jgi:hypothetical protein
LVRCPVQSSHRCLTVAAGFSLRLGRVGSQTYLDIAAAFGTSIVDFTPDGTTEEQQRSAMTFALGVGMRHRQAALTIFTGVDVLAGNNRPEWEYRRKPWIGLAATVLERRV